MSRHQTDRRDFINHPSALPLLPHWHRVPQSERRRQRRPSPRGSGSRPSASTTTTSTVRSSPSIAAAANCRRSSPKSPISRRNSRKRYPEAKRASSEKRDPRGPVIQLVVSAAIPDERAPLGIEVMRHGKDFMSDKPGMTTLEQLADVRKVQAETKRIYSILYSERHENRATIKRRRAGESGRDRQGHSDHRSRSSPHEPGDAARLVLREGALRRHHLRHRVAPVRPVPVLHGLDDGPRSSRHRWATCNHPQYPGLEDFGDVMLRGNGGTGYIRVDWFTPDGLNTWGDGRLTILGTEGFIEIRKNVDIGGPRGREPPVPGRSEGDALRRLFGRRAAVRRAARGRCAEPDGDARCRRHTSFWRWSSRSPRRRTRSESIRRSRRRQLVLGGER